MVSAEADMDGLYGITAVLTSDGSQTTVANITVVPAAI